MSERGMVVRTVIPRWIAGQLAAALERLPEDLSDLAVTGRDGTGLKSEIPWVRIYSMARAPKPTDGWYLVYLFDAFGKSIYLSLNQGTTKWTNGEFHARPSAELTERAAWAREVLVEQIGDRSDLHTTIELPTRGSKLGVGYELGNVVSIKYSAGLVPEENQLRSDLAYMVKLTTDLYEVADVALAVPGDPAPEVLDAIALSTLAAGKKMRGRKFRLSGPERKAIEDRAVSVCIAHLLQAGYLVEDVGATESYDLDARKPGERLYVEVKGTVSVGDEVILTRNEVALHREAYPSNMLAVVHGILLDSHSRTPTASGGHLRITSPWKVEDTDLTALSYSYVTPKE